MRRNYLPFNPVILIAIGVALILIFLSVTIVPPGHRGARVTLGKVTSESLGEGLYFTLPLVSHIVKLDARTQKWENKSGAYTKDVQQADVSFVLNYALEPQAAATVFQTVGTDWENKLIGQVVLEELKREIGQHEAVTLVATRDVAARRIEDGIRQKLAAKNVLISGFQITNIDYTTEFEKSVEAKVVAQQRAVEEQNRTVQIREKADQQVIAAKAEAESIRIRAQALEANPRLVEWEAVQKWDGKLPQYQLGGATPFINISGDKK